MGLQEAISRSPVIARGLGRAYGDCALNSHATIDMTGFRRMLSFNSTTGLLVVEAGVSLADIIDTFLSKGWFPPVTPGTKYVTVGGMIAADVHGKNHHKHGSFSSFVEWIDLVGPDGDVKRASREEHSDLFAFTMGGMGLTGIILRAAFRLIPVESGWIKQEVIVAPSLDKVIDAFESATDWTYSVAWIDCLASGSKLGRSLLLLGEHARQDELEPAQRSAPFNTPRKRKLRIPIDAPTWALNGWTVSAFNALYYHMSRMNDRRSLVAWDSYFYPLDSILAWNRIYGRRGFVQFQCVFPLETSRAGLACLLQEIASTRQSSFLAVLKLMGPQEGKISFPMHGYTLAVDLPINARTAPLLDRLDGIMIAHGGRSYLAKDARMGRSGVRTVRSARCAFRCVAQIVRCPAALQISTSRTAWPVSSPTFHGPVLVVGASSDIGRALAERFAKAGHALHLSARRLEEIEADRADFALRYAIDAQCHRFDVLDLDATDPFLAGLDPKPAIVISVVGLMPPQQSCAEQPDIAALTVQTNLTATGWLMEAAARHLVSMEEETALIGISSVAGDRGRARNYWYGAAKAGFSALLSGLRQKYARTSLHVMTVKPGFVRTRMTEQMDLPPALTSEPEQLADLVYKRLMTKRHVVYDLRWRLIMTVIRLLPERIFRMLTF